MEIDQFVINACTDWITARKLDEESKAENGLEKFRTSLKEKVSRLIDERNLQEVSDFRFTYQDSRAKQGESLSAETIHEALRARLEAKAASNRAASERAAKDSNCFTLSKYDPGAPTCTHQEPFSFPSNPTLSDRPLSFFACTDASCPQSISSHVSRFSMIDRQ